ncbi:MAG: hypothetical protein HOI95_08125 [Chromatiales bacterium]|jgi:hypothetical protein|nr:hypothetical protein [Chromatiales bacterium]
MRVNTDMNLWNKMLSLVLLIATVLGSGAAYSLSPDESRLQFTLEGMLPMAEKFNKETFGFQGVAEFGM